MVWWVKADEYYGPYFDWVEPEAANPGALVVSGLSPSLKIKPEWVPKAARPRRSAKKPPTSDVFNVDYTTACNGRFKALVEQFEPDLHMFAPIELRYDDGRPMEGEFYSFACNVDIDCVLTDNQSDWFRSDRIDGSISSSLALIQKLTPLDIILSKPNIEGHHLWTGGILGWNQLFISDEFSTAMKKARIRGIQRWRECHEVDRPWIAEEHMGPLLDKWREHEASGRTTLMRWI